jgi:hypothetical protein
LANSAYVQHSEIYNFSEVRATKAAIQEVECKGRRENMKDYDATKRIREIRNVLGDNDRQCFFTITEVGKLIGKKNFRTAKKFVEGLPETNINGRVCYFVNDIARKLYQNQCG